VARSKQTARARGRRAGAKTWEECRIEIQRARLVCVDYRPPKHSRRPGGLRFVFHCGIVDDEQIRGIALQPEEISEYRFADLDDAAALLSGPVRRRVLACARSDRCVYLEDGRPLGAVTG
jgi:8-oxo-dGTP pyrophosphatase MutT (NUDIX family)